MAKVLDKGLEAQYEKRRAAKERLQSSIDPVTGLFNRRAWDQFATDEFFFAEARERSHHILCVHLETSHSSEGNRILCIAAEVIRETVRDSDFVARHEGDRFAAILLDSPTETAMLLKTRIHMKLGRAGISASIGVEATRGHDSLKNVWASACHKMVAEKGVPQPA